MRVLEESSRGSQGSQQAVGLMMMILVSPTVIEVIASGCLRTKCSGEFFFYLVEMS
jgi:hypothetical protein